MHELIEGKSAEMLADVAEKKRKALEAGGLYVLGTERHESRRIDNQLRGRSGRQGDPGRSKFYLSLEDDLMRIFGSDRMDGMLQKLGLQEGEAITHPWINKALEKAQQKVEARNFDSRKYVLKYDDVMNDQRKVIFEHRIDIMGRDDVSDTVADLRQPGGAGAGRGVHPAQRLRRAVELGEAEGGDRSHLRPRSAHRPLGRRGRHRRRGDHRAADEGHRREGAGDKRRDRQRCARQVRRRQETVGVRGERSRARPPDRRAGHRTTKPSAARLLASRPDMVDSNGSPLSATQAAQVGFQFYRQHAEASEFVADIESAADKSPEAIGALQIRKIEKMVLLQTLDHLWREHLVTLEHLRQVIHFRGYGQRDPLNEYKSEGFHLFEAMLANLRQAVTGQLMHIRSMPLEEEEGEEAPQAMQPVELPPMQAHHVDPFTGEDELAMADAALAAASPARSRQRARAARAAAEAAGRRGPRSQGSRNVGQGLPQRRLPLRLRQEIQALPRQARLRRPPLSALSPIVLHDGERVGVRGGGKLQRCAVLPPLTLTLSPLKSGERGQGTSTAGPARPAAS